MTQVVVDDMKEIHDSFNAINAAEADYNNQMIDTEIRVKEVERIQAQIQQHGASRPLMEELQAISGQDDILLQRGVAIESFTSFQSRTNVSVALEMSDDVKNGLIGAAIAAGAFIVYKIFKMIYNFFKKRSSAAASIVAKKERISVALESSMEIEKLKGNNGDGSEESKKVLEEMTSVMEKQLDLVDGKWTLLLDNVFGKGGQLKTNFIKYVDESKVYSEGLVTLNNTVKSSASQMKTAGGDGFSNWIRANVEEKALKIAALKDIDHNLKEITDFAERVSSDARSEAQTSLETIANAVKVAAEAQRIWEDIDKRVKSNEGPFSDPKAFEKMEEDLRKMSEDLKNNAGNYRAQDSEYINTQLKALDDNFRKLARVYGFLTSSITLLAVQLNSFLDKTLTSHRVEIGFIRKLLSKGELAAKFSALKKLIEKGDSLVMSDEEESK